MSAGNDLRLFRFVAPDPTLDMAGRRFGGILVDRLDLLGAMVALFTYASSIAVFTARIVFELPPGHWIGFPFLLMAFPLGLLLYKAPSVDRSRLYYAQIGLMLTAIVVLFVLDYLLGLDWRGVRWAVVLFVMLYFAGMGGMIGVASHAGRAWTVVAVVLFLVTAVMAFAQRAATGI